MSAMDALDVVEHGDEAAGKQEAVGVCSAVHPNPPQQRPIFG